jgi:hypothetical protein
MEWVWRIVSRLQSAFHALGQTVHVRVRFRGAFEAGIKRHGDGKFAACR